jgi:radical SAM superfamily enzyme YgiQ (UPF0313 family)
MKFLAIVPPYASSKSKAMLPVGILVILTQLRRLGKEVELLDLTFSQDWSINLNEVSRPDAVLLECHTVRNLPTCAEIVGQLRKQWAQIYIAIGGNVCSQLDFVAFQKLGLTTDAVVRGYGHGTNVIKKLSQQQRGDIKSEESLEIFPTPAHDLLTPEQHQLYLSHSGGQYPMVTHGFGCSWNCSYCSANMGCSWETRASPQCEIFTAKALGYNHIWAVDNLVLIDGQQTVDFDQVVAELGMTWSAMTRPELVVKNQKSLKQLRALKNLAIGVETSSSKQLQNLRRGGGRTYRECLQKAFASCRAAGITTTAFVILDLPGSSEADFFCLLDDLKKYNPDYVSWSFYLPPAEEVKILSEAARYGFYNWPLGLSAVSPQKVVQQVMLLSGIYWRGWEPVGVFSNDDHFGVQFREGKIFQSNQSRASTGNLWEKWLEKEVRYET